jgi:hypothetical protein
MDVIEYAIGGLLLAQYVWAFYNFPTLIVGLDSQKGVILE